MSEHIESNLPSAHQQNLPRLKQLREAMVEAQRRLHVVMAVNAPQSLQVKEAQRWVDTYASQIASLTGDWTNV